MRADLSEAFSGYEEIIASTTRLVEGVGNDVGRVTGASAR